MCAARAEISVKCCICFSGFILASYASWNSTTPKVLNKRTVFYRSSGGRRSEQAGKGRLGRGSPTSSSGVIWKSPCVCLSAPSFLLCRIPVILGKRTLAHQDDLISAHHTCKRPSFKCSHSAVLDAMTSAPLRRGHAPRTDLKTQALGTGILLCFIPRTVLQY